MQGQVFSILKEKGRRKNEERNKALTSEITTIKCLAYRPLVKTRPFPNALNGSNPYSYTVGSFRGCVGIRVFYYSIYLGVCTMNKDLITIKEGIQELGIFEKSGDAWVSTRDIAKLFEKEHKDVLAAIREQIMPNVSNEFGQRNFPPSSYKNNQNKRQPEYLLNRKSFSIVVMGFTGKKAMQFKEAYIEAFEAMATVIDTRQLSKAGYKEMSSAIARTLSDKNDAKAYSKEATMINTIVLGMSSSDFKAINNIDEHGNTRDSVAFAMLEKLDKAQRLNAQLIRAGLPYEQREMIIKANYKKPDRQSA